MQASHRAGAPPWTGGFYAQFAGRAHRWARWRTGGFLGVGSGRRGAMLTDVEVPRLDPQRFDAVLDPGPCRRFVDGMERAADRLRGRRLWHLNSTGQGG